MLCDGEGYSWNQDNSWPKNGDIVEAFSASGELSLHCIINSAKRELFVVASSCRNAKILAIFHGHLEGLGCGHCSARYLEKYTKRASKAFWEKAEAIMKAGEPGVVWSAGYFAEDRDLSEKRMQALPQGGG